MYDRLMRFVFRSDGSFHVLLPPCGSIVSYLPSQLTSFLHTYKYITTKLSHISSPSLHYNLPSEINSAIHSVFITTSFSCHLSVSHFWLNNLTHSLPHTGSIPCQGHTVLPITAPHEHLIIPHSLIYPQNPLPVSESRYPYVFLKHHTASLFELFYSWKNTRNTNIVNILHSFYVHPICLQQC